MKKSLLGFLFNKLEDYFEATINILIFLPYFFSVKTLLKTLFHPWKNIKIKTSQPGFSFSNWLNNLSFNLISRSIGLSMRTCILLSYLLFQTLGVVLIPLMIFFYLLFFPILVIEYYFLETEEEKKAEVKKIFISNHLLKTENFSKVESWFEKYYKKTYVKSSWWTLKKLLSVPPLAKDWSSGYTPTVDEFSTDLSSYNYVTDKFHLVDRKDEIKQIEQILLSSNSGNVLIVGEEGVGKHTIVDAFAKQIYEGNCAFSLKYKRVLKLNMEKIFSKSKDHEEREKIISDILKESESAGNVIIFIDDIDRYILPQGGSIDLTFVFSEYLKKANIQFIGVTTPFMYEKCIFVNEKISHLFNKVDVYEIDKAKAEDVLLENFKIYENRYKISLPYETLKAVIDKSDFFITYIPFPEKALKLLDEVCIFVTQNTSNKTALPEIVDRVIFQISHIPVSLSEEMKVKLSNLENLLGQKIINQTEAISEVSSALRRAFLLIGKRKKPLATLLLLGTTGVGKTGTAKAVADTFFGDSEKKIMRFDMSLYQSKTDIPKLLGEPGKDPGLLVKSIREQPYGVLLLDEIEKADKSLINIFLTLFDEGYFTDGYGKRVDCKNLIVIATSNAGSKELALVNNAGESKKIISYLSEKNIFSPEFLNRFDGIVLYKELDSASVKNIAKNIASQISTQLYELYKVKVNISDSKIDDLIIDYNPQFGVRDIERILRKDVEDVIAKKILSGEVKEGEVLYY